MGARLDLGSAMGATGMPNIAARASANMPLQRVGSHLEATTTPQLSGQKTYKTSRLKSGAVEEYSEKSMNAGI